MYEGVVGVECERDRSWDCEIRISNEDFSQDIKEVEDVDEIKIATKNDRTDTTVDGGFKMTRSNLDPMECSTFFDRTTKRLRCKEPDMV